MNYFIMMNSQSGKDIMPLVREDEEVELFDTLDEAQECAKEHVCCQCFGYEIFERGAGEQ
jgi:hypothetical protein